MSSYRGDLSPSELEDLASFKDTTCRYCHGLGWIPPKYNSGPVPCGCDEGED